MSAGSKSFSIGRASRITGVPRHVLRYWETEFPALRPRKNLSGRREYGKMEIDLIFRIKHLLYNELYTVAGARKKLESKSDSAGAGEAVKFLLQEISGELRSILGVLE